LLKHHQYPCEFAVITRCLWNTSLQKLADELGADKSPSGDAVKRIFDELAQSVVANEPWSKRQSETVLFLTQNLSGQEFLERLLEEPPQLQALEFPARRYPKREIGQRSAEKRIAYA